MGFSIGKIVRAVAAPVTQTVKTVASVAKGDISGAAKNAAGAVVSTNPLQMGDNASGGAISSVSGAVPVIGSPLNKSLTSGQKIGTGNFSGRDARTYIRETGKVAGLVAGGYALGSAAGVPAVLAATRGSYSGVAEAAGVDPEVSSLVSNFGRGFRSPSSGGGSTAIAPLPESLPTGQKKGLSKNEKIALGAAAAIAGIFIVRKMK